ncbi:MAG: hypothetical protein CO140_00710 [Candidatus Moranbacteria bacterium CG_4_9_14_3_um_filter_40_7]|nr:MAG: hypothetical protein COS71_01160 [Candidatus Moranbacteria bacterium CG06_land_8_20_14_3_00_40_12]PJA88103.1 MAG: hypothetical protein CO140_00710 [Candidatus Moranbacteria bacterium CG_4_9_14_3_um_filter_40_7]
MLGREEKNSQQTIWLRMPNEIRHLSVFDKIPAFRYTLKLSKIKIFFKNKLTLKKGEENAF